MFAMSIYFIIPFIWVKIISLQCGDRSQNNNYMGEWSLDVDCKAASLGEIFYSAHDLPEGPEGSEVSERSEGSIHLAKVIQLHT